MKRIWIPMLLLVLAHGGLFSSEARGQVALSPAQKREAVRLDRRAYKAWGKGDIKGALKLWLRAYSRWPKPLLLYNVALAYEQLKEPVRAVSYLRDYLKQVARGGGKAAIVAQARKRLTLLRKQVAVLTVRGPKGSSVLIDGKPVGASPVEVVIAPGAHVILVVKGKVRLGRQTISLQAGGTETVTVLTPIPAAPPRKRTARARPILRRSPPRSALPGPGGARAGGARAGGARAGAARAGSAPARGETSRGLPMGYALAAAAVSVAAILAAAGTGVAALRLNRRFRDSGSEAARVDGMRLQDATNGLWGVAAAAGVTAVVLAIFTRWRRPARERRHVRLVLLPSIGGGSLTAMGRF